MDEATSNGTTGLMKAAHSGREEVVKLLLGQRERTRTVATTRTVSVR